MQAAGDPRVMLSPRPVPHPAPGASADSVVVVAQNALASAALAWKERAERLLVANSRLKDRVAEVEAAHRKSLTVVKNVPALPNNHVFTKQLVDENHALRQQMRALQRRLMRVRGLQFSAQGSSMEGPNASGTTRRSSSSEDRSHSIKGVKQRRATATATAASQTSGNGITVQDAEVSNAQTEVMSIPSSHDVEPMCTPLVQELKVHLQALEVDLERLRQENELLRCELGQKEQGEQYANGQARKKHFPSASHKQDGAVDTTDKHSDQKELMGYVAAQLQQMKVLEARYHHLDAKARSKQTLYKEGMARLEEVTSQLFDAQQRITAQGEKIQAHADQSALVEDLQKEVHLLRSENLTLNKTIATLSSRPFDTLSKDLQKKNLWISQLEDEKNDLEKERAKVQQECVAIRRSSEKLRDRVKSLTAETNDLARRLSDAERETEQQKMEKEVTELQLRFYLGPGDKTLMTAVGKALKEMRKQERKLQPLVAEAGNGDLTTLAYDSDNNHGVAAAATDFVCSTCLRANEDVEVGTLQRERLLKMSELSTLMQEDAKEEIRSLKLVHMQEVQALQRDLRRSEKRVATFLEQIALLQREKGEILDQRRSSRINSPQMDLPAALGPAPPPARSALSKSLAANPPLGNTDVILEITFTNLRVTVDLGASRTPSFILVCDYYDFEPQVSPVLIPQLTTPGSKLDVGATSSVEVPIDFGITFKLVVNPAFLRLPLSRLASLELQQISFGNTSIVAVATLPLDSLFLSTDGQTTLALKLVNPYNQVPIGSLRTKMKLSHPVDHVFKAIMRGSKASRTTVDVESRCKLVQPDLNMSSRRAELEIRVVSLILTKAFVTRWESDGGPDFCLNYRFMGFPLTSIDVHTSTTTVTGGCYFLPLNRSRVFEISSSKDFLAFLRKYELDVRLCSKTLGASTKLSNSSQQDTRHENLGVGHASFQDLIQCVSGETSTSATGSGSCSSTSILYSSLGLYDPSESSRLHGRLAIELRFNGLHPGVGLSISEAQLRRGAAALFMAEGGKLVDWNKYCRVMELTPLERTTRQLILDKHQPMVHAVSSERNLSISVQGKQIKKLVAHVKAARAAATNRDALGSWDALRGLFTEAGLHFHRMDVVAIFAGLRASTEGSKTNVGLGPGVPATFALWDELELLCETCQTSWLRVEDPLRLRSQTLGILRTTSADMIPWKEFLRRIGAGVSIRL